MPAASSTSRKSRAWATACLLAGVDRETASQSDVRVHGYIAAMAEYRRSKQAGCSIRSVARAFQLCGVTATGLQGRLTGELAADARRGRPPKVPPATVQRIMLASVARQKRNDCVGVPELQAKFASAAAAAGTPYANVLPKPQHVRSAVKRFNAAAPPDQQMGVGKGRPTSLARQMSSSDLDTVTDYADAFVEIGQLDIPPSHILTADETPMNSNAEHAVGTKVVYSKSVRKANGGAARQATCGHGQRMTVFSVISGDGHVYPPGFLVAGSYPQPGWTAEPYPPGMTGAEVKSAVITCTPSGVQTSQSFLVHLERVVLEPARARLGYGKKLVVVLDGASSHGIDLEHLDVSAAVAALFVKYDAVLIPVPANTSTALSPLDLAFFALFKQYLRRLLSSIAAVHSTPELQVHPTRLELQSVPLPADATAVPAAFERALYLEPKLGPRTHILGVLLIFKAKAASLSAAASKSFAKAHIVPFNREKMLAIACDAHAPAAPALLRRSSPRADERRELVVGATAAAEQLAAAAALGNVDRLRAAVDAAVDLLRLLPTEGQRQDRIDALPLEASGPEKVSGQRTVSAATGVYTTAQLEAAMSAAVSKREAAKQAKRAEKDAEKAAKKATRDAERAAKQAAAEAERAAKKAAAEAGRAAKKAAAEAERAAKKAEAQTRSAKRKAGAKPKPKPKSGAKAKARRSPTPAAAAAARPRPALGANNGRPSRKRRRIDAGPEHARRVRTAPAKLNS